ncbi:15239_t:CDS:2, partial [Gigaspora rosea]
MEHKKSKQTVFTDNEDKENKPYLQDYKTAETQKVTTQETISSNETLTATIQPLSWDAQDATNSINTERSKENKWDNEDFIDDNKVKKLLGLNRYMNTDIDNNEKEQQRENHIPENEPQ